MKRKISKTLLIICLISSFLAPIPQARAQGYLNLPEPGTMVSLSQSFEPVVMKGLTVHPENPLLFDFIMDEGQEKLPSQLLKNEGEKLIKYFLASLAIPEEDLWVNLSPYEKDRTIPEALSQTDMGRDLLEQDYMLKQVTASLIYPEKQLGKTFWDKVYSQAQALYGTTQIPVNTFNKVWIVADRASVYQENNSFFVVDQHLKVMLEQDYLALEKHNGLSNPTANVKDSNITNQIIRDIVLPALENEVNKGKNFTQLRQIYNSLILASWYKNNLKEVLLNQVYANQKNVKGIDLQDKKVKEAIYQQYLKAYKKGVFNYIKEDVDVLNAQNRIPRKYFSGGWRPGKAGAPVREFSRARFDGAMKGSLGHLSNFRVNLDLIQAKAQNSLEQDHAILTGEEEKYTKFNNFIRTVVWFKPNKKIPQVRISEMWDLDVSPEEEKIIKDNIDNDGHIFLLNEQTLRLTKDGPIYIELNDTMGRIPPHYLGKKILLSENVMELLDDFNPSGIPSEIGTYSKISIKVGGFFRIRILDKESGKYLYLLNLNGEELNKNGKYKISPVGGGYEFEEGGFERYKKFFPMMQSMPDENPSDIRVYIPGNNWPEFLKLFSSGLYRERYPSRELVEELNGHMGVFQILPKRWVDPSKISARVKPSQVSVEAPLGDGALTVNGGIDLNMNNVSIKKLGLSTLSGFDSASIVRIKNQGFDALNFKIQSISPIANLLGIFNQQ